MLRSARRPQRTESSQPSSHLPPEQIYTKAGTGTKRCCRLRGAQPIVEGRSPSRRTQAHRQPSCTDGLQIKQTEVLPSS
ncbi:unnamed protein product [Menidia menidia]|uniref:(Atlantic silverside) hypothetical protein n=1 Tax=Menidia menidia TaxID=238744 RepID=A0A8S4BJK4_9TELE|nr:unnamed protein product [Menidia menidia]